MKVSIKNFSLILLLFSQVYLFSQDTIKNSSYSLIRNFNGTGDTGFVMTIDYKDGQAVGVGYEHSMEFRKIINVSKTWHLNGQLQSLYIFSRDSLNVERNRSDFVFFSDDKVLDSIKYTQSKLVNLKNGNKALTNRVLINEFYYSWYPNGNPEYDFLKLGPDTLVHTYYDSNKNLLFEKEYVFGEIKFNSGEGFLGWYLDGNSIYYRDGKFETMITYKEGREFKRETIFGY